MIEIKNIKPLKTKICISLDEAAIKRIKELSEKDDRSFSQYVNKILKAY